MWRDMRIRVGYKHLIFHFFLYITIIGVVTFFGKTYFSSVLKRKTLSENEFIEIQYYLNAGGRARHLIETSGCKIPDFNPMDPSILDAIGQPLRFKCDNFSRSLVYRYKDKLIIDLDLIGSSSDQANLSYCTTSAIVRPVNKTTDHNSWEIRPPKKPFRHFHKLHEDEEYVFLQCYVNESTNATYEDFFQYVSEKSDVEKKCSDHQRRRQIKLPKVVEPISIMAIGLDSVSRLNNIRYMPKIRKYLLKELGAIQLDGYNKVGDNTIHNMVPFLVGKFLHELPWDDKDQVIFDNFKFIWKEYSDMGYRTLFLEDFAEGAIFDYLKPGFHLTPTDYYNRHFELALGNMTRYWYEAKNCFLDRSQTDIVLDYTSQFMSTFKNKPYFGFVFITRLTHDYLGRAAFADDVYLDFLTKMKKEGNLNNTVLFFFGDHGLRFEKIRERFIGKAEDRLPMMYIAFPEWFQKKYPKVLDNLKFNSHQLTTPFDIYETFSHLLHFDGEVRSNVARNRGYSLLNKIPSNRTCSEAEIDPHWCMCSEMKAVDTTRPLIQRCANVIIQSLNDHLLPFQRLCHELSLEKVLTAYKEIPSLKEMNMRFAVFQLTVQTYPGHGVFEATVIYDNHLNNLKLVNDISRISRYGHEKRCDVDYLAEKICYCKSNDIV